MNELCVCHESQLYVYLLLAIIVCILKCMYEHVMNVCELVLSGCSVTTPSFVCVCVSSAT